MTNVMDIPSDIDNYLLFKNNIEYEQIRFMQVMKIINRLMTIFFNNFILASMQNYLSYKIVDKIGALLLKLLYDKVT